MGTRSRVQSTGRSAQVLYHERALVEQAAAGDTDAFERLMKRYHDRLYRYAHVRLGPQDAEDLLQDLYLAVWQELPSFRWERGGSLSGWMFAILRNMVADRHRRKRVVLVPLDGAAEPSVEFEQDAVSERYLRSALDELPARQRDVLILRLLVGLTTAEVASAMGRSESRVKDLQRRGLSKLRRSMGEQR
ncbi:MAG TPA: sigma-70 family RNA polymerase sigma factor [Actinomycetota bacterium]|nr:sigma-70 family RNA polymerase sigma factor [Actinomycetota bacterium]